MARFAHDIEARRVPGAIVEYGVLDGGIGHSWQPLPGGGLPNSSENDGPAAKIWAGDVGSQARFRAIMRPKRRSGSPKLSEGMVLPDLPKANISKVALLHIDANFYGSVRL